MRDRRLGGYKFRRQYAIGRYIADFYCSEARLVIEDCSGLMPILGRVIGWNGVAGFGIIAFEEISAPSPERVRIGPESVEPAEPSPSPDSPEISSFFPALIDEMRRLRYTESGRPAVGLALRDRDEVPAQEVTGGSPCCNGTWAGCSGAFPRLKASGIFAILRLEASL